MRKIPEVERKREDLKGTGKIESKKSFVRCRLSSLIKKMSIKKGGYHIIIAILIFSCFHASSPVVAQSTLTGPELVDRSIDFHDPGSRWNARKLSFQLRETRPEVPDRSTHITINGKKGTFQLDQHRGPNRIKRTVSNSGCHHKVNGTEPTEAQIKELALTCDRSKRMQNYYTYLLGLPMKLKDPGTIIHNAVDRVDFFGTDLLQVKVTYEESVGSDTWYFYFHPETYAMRGYRFYHDEAKNDGEYILIDGMESISGIKIPASRRWYTHAEAKFLGEDILVGN